MEALAVVSRIAVCIVCIGAPVTRAGEVVFALGDAIAGGKGCGASEHEYGASPRSGVTAYPEQFGGSGAVGGKYFTTNGSGGKALLPVVDGVFSIDGTTKVDSLGTTFPFPDTAGGYTFDAIRHGVAYLDDNDYPVPIVLLDAGATPREGLGLPTNAGVTFDLPKFVAAWPGARVVRIEGVFGISSLALGHSARFLTLLDGAVVHDVTIGGPGLFAPFSITVPAGARFLTFAVIDTDPTTPYDGAVIADAAAIATGPIPDCDGNQRADACDLQIDPSLDCDLDGRPDSCEWQAIPYGTGHPGTYGFLPLAKLTGCVGANGILYYTVDHGMGGTAAVVLIGKGATTIPLSGGPTLLVADVLVSSPLVMLGGSAPGQGNCLIFGPLPHGLAPYQSLFLQTIIHDPFVKGGLSATAGIELRTLETN